MIRSCFNVGHEGGELVFQNEGGYTQFGLEHELGVGVLHLGSHHHLVINLNSGIIMTELKFKYFLIFFFSLTMQ